jgi:hypothetical protein
VRQAGKRPVIGATIAFGLGVDKPDVRRVCVLDYHTALDQEWGRAGRDGERSVVTLLVTSLAPPRVDGRGLSPALRAHEAWRLRLVHVAARMGACGGDAWAPLRFGLGLGGESEGGGNGEGEGASGGADGASGGDESAGGSAGGALVVDAQGALLTVLAALEVHGRAAAVADRAAAAASGVPAASTSEAACDDWTRVGTEADLPSFHGAAVRTCQLHGPAARRGFEDLELLLALAGLLERSPAPPHRVA